MNSIDKVNLELKKDLHAIRQELLSIGLEIWRINKKQKEIGEKHEDYTQNMLKAIEIVNLTLFNHFKCGGDSFDEIKDDIDFLKEELKWKVWRIKCLIFKAHSNLKERNELFPEIGEDSKEADNAFLQVLDKLDPLYFFYQKDSE